ncbi:MAG: ureidoglycolate lyase [Alphaproteobacteria bacterium]
MATIRLTPEPMTATSFAPFGEVWEAGDQSADARTMTPMTFDYDGRVTANVIWQPAGGLTFSKLERHFGVTQAFVHMGGEAAVVCVALASASDDPADVPEPASVRAFELRPGLGFAYRRGTWHSLDRYLPTGPGGSFLILNSDPNPTHIVDYATGVAEIHPDLGGAEPPREIKLAGDFGTEFVIVA